MPMILDRLDKTKVLNRWFYTELTVMSVLIFVSTLYYIDKTTDTIKWSDPTYFFGSLWISMCMGGFFIYVALDYFRYFSKVPKRKIDLLIVYALKCWKTSLSATMLSSYLFMVSGVFMMLQVWLYHQIHFEYKLLTFFSGFTLVGIGFAILLIYFFDIVKTFHRHTH